jgi:hypothetical protein
LIVLELPLKIRLCRFFLALTVLQVALKTTMIRVPGLLVAPKPVGAAELDFALVAVADWADESARAVGNSLDKGAFIVALVGVVVDAYSVGSVILK